MTRRLVWKCSVDWGRAIELLHLGCGRRIKTWDDQTWRYWRELGWDERPDSERDTQPDEVYAYSLSPLEVLALGVVPYEPASGVLFVFLGIRKAMVAMETRIERVLRFDE